MYLYMVQCLMANEKVTLEGTFRWPESAISSVLGDSQGIIFSVVVSFERSDI